MAKFIIQTHQRLQEWVAEERGYFRAQGLDYEFISGTRIQGAEGSVKAADGGPQLVKQGAFESMEAGRSCDVSAACHWAVNMAASASHGRMWGHAYSVTPCGIMVAPESPIKTAENLKGIEIGVGYHSGSHFTTLQTLAKHMVLQDIKLRFIGPPWDRVNLLLERRVEAATVFGMHKDIVEQQGFRKVVDATFMIGFLVSVDTVTEDVQKYFNALQRAQRDIDLEGEQFKHFYLREMPEKYHPMVDVGAFSAGERLVFEPYTQEMYEKTHRWMEEIKIFDANQTGHNSYQQAMVV